MKPEQTLRGWEGNSFSREVKKKSFPVQLGAFQLLTVLSFPLLSLESKKKKPKTPLCCTEYILPFKKLLGWPVFPPRAVKTSFIQKEYRQG